MISGILPKNVLALFFGGNLFPFAKKDSGVRSIAVGNTLRKLVAKIIPDAQRDRFLFCNLHKLVSLLREDARQPFMLQELLSNEACTASFQLCF